MIPIVLDTNVFISGIFWSGPPYLILDAWRKHKIKILYSSDIRDEYIRIGKVLSTKYEGIDISGFIDLLTIHGELHIPAVLENQISQDPDDDKFIACALGANCNIIISGDQDLLKVSGFNGLEIIKPTVFVKEYLNI